MDVTSSTSKRIHVSMGKLSKNMPKAFARNIPRIVHGLFREDAGHAYFLALGKGLLATSVQVEPSCRLRPDCLVETGTAKC